MKRATIGQYIVLCAVMFVLATVVHADTSQNANNMIRTRIKETGAAWSQWGQANMEWMFAADPFEVTTYYDDITTRYGIDISTGWVTENALSAGAGDGIIWDVTNAEYDVNTGDGLEIDTDILKVKTSDLTSDSIGTFEDNFFVNNDGVIDTMPDWGTAATQIESSDLPNIVTNFDGNLSASDTDVLAALETLDETPIGGGLSVFYLETTASDIGGYKEMTVTYANDSARNSSASIVADATAIEEWASASNEPNQTVLIGGVYSFHFHAQQTAGTKSSTIYAELYKRASGGGETLLVTFHETTDLTGASTAYTIHVVVTEQVILATDRLVLKVLGNEGGAGTDPTAQIDYQSTTITRLEFPGVGGGSTDQPLWYTLTYDDGDTDAPNTESNVKFVGGTGIATSGAGGTPPVDLDIQIDFVSTDIGSTVWGSGSGFTWTFDGSAGADTTVAFADDLMTFGTVIKVNGSSTGDVIADDFDLILGGTGAGEGGAMMFGAAEFGYEVSSHLLGSLELGGAITLVNAGTPIGNSVFIFAESAGGVVRFGIPKSGAGLGTYNPRSFIIAGPATQNENIYVGTTWGFDQIDMDTGATGADLGVQDDVQVLGRVLVGESVYVEEMADALADIAGYGQWWSDNTTPSVPMFTDDTGNDFELTTSGPMYLQFNLGVTGASADTYMFYGLVSTTAANSPALMRAGSITGVSFVQTADLQPPIVTDVWNIQVYVNGANVWTTQISDGVNENEFYATQVVDTDNVSAGDNITVFCDYVSGTTDLANCMAIVEVTFHN